MFCRVRYPLFQIVDGCHGHSLGAAFFQKQVSGVNFVTFGDFPAFLGRSGL